MFKLREIWESTPVKSEEFSPDAFCTFRFDNQPCFATGSLSGKLRFYFPSKAADSEPYTELHMKGPILQLGYDAFIKIGSPTLAVLMPNLLVLYELLMEEKTINIKEVQSYLLSHSSYNFISCFLDGSAKGLNIIVQSLDGYLTVLSVSGTVSYRIPHFFLPGPFIYIPPLEMFIFASSDYRVISFRKTLIMGQQTGEAVDEWNYVFGEQVVNLHYWQTATKYVTKSNFQIGVVGVRHLAVLSDNGRLKMITRHTGNALSSYAYVSQGDGGKSCNNLIIASDDKYLSIYVNFNKIWQLILPRNALSINITTIDPNPGMIATMGSEGTLNVGYLGTHDEKNLNFPKLPLITEQQLQEQVIKINERINQTPSADHIQVFVNVSRSSPNHVEVVLQPAKIVLQDVNCYVDVPPSINSVPPFSVEKLEKDEISFQMELSATPAPPARLNIGINVVFSTQNRRMLSKSVSVDIPFEFYIRRVEARVKGACRSILFVNGQFADLVDLFPNLVLKDPHSLSMVLTNGEIVSISSDSKNKRYRVESDRYFQLGFAMNILEQLLFKKSKSTLISKDKVEIQPLIEIAKEHYNLRVQERELQQKIHSHVTELESVQKALIVRYEAATPEPLDDLNELLNKITSILKEETTKIMELKQLLNECGTRLEAACFTFLLSVTYYYGLPEKTSALLHKYIPNHFENCTPGWEECTVTNIAALLKRFATGKPGNVYGSTPDFLSNFESLVDAFDSLITFFDSKVKKA